MFEPLKFYCICFYLSNLALVILQWQWVCTVLQRISSFERSTETTSTEYLKLNIVANFCPFTMIFFWMPLELHVISLVVSARFMPFADLPRLLNFPCFSAARASKTSAPHICKRFYTNCSIVVFMKRDIILSRKILKRVDKPNFSCSSETLQCCCLSGPGWSKHL